MSTGLFSEFDKVSAKQWKQKIQVDLKGEDYNQTLIWNSHDGVDVKPFYHPDEAPEALKTASGCGWNICEQIYVSSAEKAARKALNALGRGAESLWFVIPSEEVELQVLLAEIPSETTVYLDCKFLSESFLLQLAKIPSEKKQKLHLLTDIIGKLARTGNWFDNLKDDHALMDKALSSADTASVLSVNMDLYQNAGANIPQQLAYGLAHANEYLNHLNDTEVLSKAGELTMLFQVAIGPNYFFEIAKLRALRLLYASLAREYGFNVSCIILAGPSRRNKTLYDYNVNLLRTTTECMSAVLGGADSICNLPYDVLYHKNNEFGSRIARNQLLILKHESYFEKVVNPAEGSYYIESLTRQFSERALEIFRDIEKGGGFLKQLKEGIPQRKIIESAKKEQEDFDQGRNVLIGTNKHANPQDRMKSEIELYPFLKKKVRKTLLSPILERRLAESLEQERLKEEDQKAGS